MAHFGNPWINLVAGKLATLARLSSLGDLDLQLFGVDQIVAGHAEAARSYLLNTAVARIAVFIRSVTGGVFATFAGVAPSADAIHRNGQRLVGFLANRT